MTSPDTLNFDLRVEQGEREVFPFPVLDGDDPATITGWAVDAQIKVRPGGPVLYTFPADKAKVVGGTTVELTIEPLVSAAWTWTSGYYRIKIQDPEDATNVQRIAQGAFLVSQD